MMDLSDGLAADLPRLARASGVGFALNFEAIPRHEGCDWEAAMTDGEDYELLMTLPEVPPEGSGVTVIGRITETDRNPDRRRVGSFFQMKKKLGSEDETRMFGGEIAAELKPGDAIGLIGQLGAGKTHFSQGLVTALGSNESVTSPTFTLVNEYHDGRLPVYHFDFYRMEDINEVLRIGWDEFLDEPGILIVEWADKFPELMPDNTQWFRFQIEDDGSRTVKTGRRRRIN